MYLFFCILYAISLCIYAFVFCIRSFSVFIPLYFVCSRFVYLFLCIFIQSFCVFIPLYFVCSHFVYLFLCILYTVILCIYSFVFCMQYKPQRLSIKIPALKTLITVLSNAARFGSVTFMRLFNDFPIIVQGGNKKRRLR